MTLNSADKDWEREYLRQQGRIFSIHYAAIAGKDACYAHPDRKNTAGKIIP